HSQPQSLVHNMALSILGAHEQSSMKSPAVPVWDELISTSLSKRQGTPFEAQLKTLDSHVRGELTGRELQTADEGSVPTGVEEADLDGAPRHSRKLRDREPQNQ